MTGPSVQDRAAAPTDGELLGRFVHGRDAAALDALVRRHGPMVLGVCRRVLHDPHAADDAFQATFLILVQKAGTLDRPELVGNWLYGVACRVARKARARPAPAAELPRQVVDMRPVEPDTELVWKDVRRVLDEELGRLPEKYRLPVVLCYLEGRTNEEAGRKLGWPLGTVAGRLSRARDLLRSRLARRGLALTGGLLGLFLTNQRLSAAVAGPLHRATVHAALRVADGASAAAAASPAVAELTAAAADGLPVGSRLGLLLVAAAVLLLTIWVSVRALGQSPPADAGGAPAPGCCHCGGGEGQAAGP
jgi:RNA polymerase sigma factor (sigma-70 family)